MRLWFGCSNDDCVCTSETVIKKRDKIDWESLETDGRAVEDLH